MLWPHTIVDVNPRFRLAMNSGLIPATVASTNYVWVFRWNHATYEAWIHKISISAAVSTTYFAAGVPFGMALARVTTWDSQPTGGTAITMNAVGKYDPNQASSVLPSGDMRIATTGASGLTMAGTPTTENPSLGSFKVHGNIAAPGNIIPINTVLFDAREAPYGKPIRILPNGGTAASTQGIGLYVGETPGSGTWKFSLEIEWSEVPGLTL